MLKLDLTLLQQRTSTRYWNSTDIVLSSTSNWRLWAGGVRGYRVWSTDLDNTILGSLVWSSDNDVPTDIALNEPQPYCCF